MFQHTMTRLREMIPSTAPIAEAYLTATEDEQRFINNLTLFLGTFLKEHGQLLEDVRWGPCRLLRPYSLCVLIFPQPHLSTAEPPRAADRGPPLPRCDILCRREGDFQNLPGLLELPDRFALPRRVGFWEGSLDDVLVHGRCSSPSFPPPPLLDRSEMSRRAYGESLMLHGQLSPRRQLYAPFLSEVCMRILSQRRNSFLNSTQLNSTTPPPPFRYLTNVPDAHDHGLPHGTTRGGDCGRDW